MAAATRCAVSKSFERPRSSVASARVRSGLDDASHVLRRAAKSAAPLRGVGDRGGGGSWLMLAIEKMEASLHGKRSSVECGGKRAGEVPVGQLSRAIRTRAMLGRIRRR